MKKYNLFQSGLCHLGLHDFRSIKAKNIFYEGTNILKEIQNTKRCTRCGKTIVDIYGRRLSKQTVSSDQSRSKPK